MIDDFDHSDPLNRPVASLETLKKAARKARKPRAKKEAVEA